MEEETRHTLVVLACLINPIGASGLGPGVIKFFLGPKPSTKLSFEQSRHLYSYSRWFWMVFI